MTKQFNIQNFLSENREVVISKYNEISNNKFFTGITLKDFMMQVYSRMDQQNAKSEKKASSILPTILGEVAFNNSRPYTF